MKLKPTVMLQGTVMQPLMTGRKAHYCQNGFWKTTGNVVCVLEQDDTHVKFETDTVCYCIYYFYEGTGNLARQHKRKLRVFLWKYAAAVNSSGDLIDICDCETKQKIFT